MDADGPEAPEFPSLADARPDPDRVAMDQARARAERALFGSAAPARLGRYELLERIAGGAMGTVYSAQDPELDRRVALKVLHAHQRRDERSEKRLITEARALAKLDHPNVVKVNDVVELEGQLAIVMALVEGETLAVWESAAPRPTRAIVDVYAQAGEGLAAAHGVDVVHRDFKPANAVLGTDGRVRVLDFGLARLADDAPDEAGDFFGTLSYAAPEQLRGEPVTAASDQFSFCVALYRALYGSSPFTGTTIVARLASIQASSLALGSGVHIVPARNGGASTPVPAWLRDVLQRGLAPDPTARFPTMTALVHELRRPRGWRRWRIPVVLAAAAAIALGSTAVAVTRSKPAAAIDPCDGDPARVAAVWNATERGRVLDALDRVNTPYERATRLHVVDGFDHYASAWRTGHRAACVAHRSGVNSSPLLDRRMTCLDQRLGDLRAAVSVVASTDALTLPKVMDVVARMPAIARCEDLQQLQSDVELPVTPAARVEVSVVRSEISGAEALARAGRDDQAVAAGVAAIERAARTSYVPVEIEAQLAQSRTLMSVGRLAAAKELLASARTRAFERRMLAPGIEAAARLVYIDAMLAPDLARTRHDGELLLPLAAGHECDHFARPLLLNNLGAATLAAGHRAEALDYFLRARADLGTYEAPDLELVAIDRNAAMLIEDPVRRVTLATAAWQRIRDTLGDTHPSSLGALEVLAELTPDARAAYVLVAQASDAYHQFHPTLRRATAATDLYRALLASELGAAARTRADYARAVEASADDTDADLITWHHIATGEQALADGLPNVAIAELTVVSRARLTSEYWYERADGLRAEVGIGLAELALGHRDAARAHLEIAISGYPWVLAINDDMSSRRLSARARSALEQLH